MNIFDGERLSEEARVLDEKLAQETEYWASGKEIHHIPFEVTQPTVQSESTQWVHNHHLAIENIIRRSA